MAGTVARLGPEYINNTSENVTGANPIAGTYHIITYLKVVNTDVAAVTLTLFIGATGAEAAGTEIADEVSIAAKGEWEHFGRIRLGTTDFLVGMASTDDKLVITGTIEKYVA
jgi:hypothetical protein